MSKSDPINVAEAKANFSLLLDRAASGEEIVISRSGKPIARLMPLEDPPKRIFGIASHWKETDDAWAPMSEEDLRWAEGYYQNKDGFYDKEAVFRLEGGKPAEAKPAKRKSRSRR
jgi:prevent-host-death family protein